MDWQTVGSFAAIAALGVSLSVLHQIKQLARRIDAIEIDRAWFTSKRDEQLQHLESDIYEIKDLLKDLVDFQKCDGRYRHDPNDPRLTAHVRDQTGQDY
jgi:hypothetical protein